MKINTKFDINQTVYILELKISGKILSIYIKDRIEYNVRFFNGCDPKEVYFLEEELSNTNPIANLGFESKV